MSDCCDHLTACPVYEGKLANKKGMKNMFQRRYCEGDYEKCARLKVASTVGGSHVEEGLLPNQSDKAEEIIKNASAS